MEYPIFTNILSNSSPIPHQFLTDSRSTHSNSSGKSSLLVKVISHHHDGGKVHKTKSYAWRRWDGMGGDGGYGWRMGKMKGYWGGGIGRMGGEDRSVGWER